MLSPMFFPFSQEASVHLSSSPHWHQTFCRRKMPESARRCGYDAMRKIRARRKRRAALEEAVGIDWLGHVLGRFLIGMLYGRHQWLVVSVLETKRGPLPCWMGGLRRIAPILMPLGLGSKGRCRFPPNVSLCAPDKTPAERFVTRQALWRAGYKSG